MPRDARRLLSVLLGVASAVAATAARAGGGPENVFLVVNANRADSRTIADHYAKLRRVPRGNLFEIDWRHGDGAFAVEVFRERLLKPILEEINRRRLARQIDYVVYSSGFPWRIDLQRDFPDLKRDRRNLPYASLTGATYLYRLVLAKHEALLGLKTNWYAPIDAANLVAVTKPTAPASRGFRAMRVWQPNGESGNDPKKGVRYLLSTMLAVTTERGNSMPEALEYLKRASLADNVPPRGTFYFVRNRSPRSTPRHRGFDSVADQLRLLGAKAKILSGAAPSGVDDALGLVMGTADYSLAKSRVRLMPGAIGDNLTSYGGVMKNGTGQTPLSEPLRHGAAGASGTVCEPTNALAKFPQPTLMLHYRRGCSLAEAYYQSVANPYQLLIVGDPLCQPWAPTPRVALPDLEANPTVSGVVTFRPQITPAEGSSVKFWDLFLDGRLITRAPAGLRARLDLSQLAEGAHEVRVVAIADGPIEAQGRWIGEIVVAQPLAPDSSAPKSPAGGSPGAKSPGSKSPAAGPSDAKPTPPPAAPPREGAGPAATRSQAWRAGRTALTARRGQADRSASRRRAGSFGNNGATGTTRFLQAVCASRGSLTGRPTRIG